MQCDVGVVTGKKTSLLKRICGENQWELGDVLVTQLLLLGVQEKAIRGKLLNYT